MDLSSISTLLASKGLGTIASTIFTNKMPAAVQEGLLVTSQRPIGISTDVRDLRRGSFQVIARSATHEGARAAANSVIDAMPTGGQIGDMLFRVLHPEHEPLLYPRSDGNSIEASVNFKFVYIAT